MNSKTPIIAINEYGINPSGFCRFSILANTFPKAFLLIPETPKSKIISM